MTRFLNQSQKILSIMKLNVAKVFIFLILAWSCKSNAPVQQVETESNARPQWLNRRPIDPNYYIGISGSSKMKDKFGYASSSQTKALENIASEIKVKVESNSVLYELEKNSEFKDSYESVVQSKTSQNLEGYELVDSWENEEEYWVYYRLSKVKYKELQEQKHTAALEKAKGYYLRAIDASKQKELSLAVKMHLSSLKALQAYLGELNEYRVNGQDISLTQANFEKLQSIFLKIKIQGDNVYQNTRGVTRNQEIFVSTFYDNHLAKGVPVKIMFKNGKGLFSSSHSLNASGETKFVLDKITSPALTQELLITLDEGVFDEDFLSKALLKNMQLPKKIVTMEVNNPMVFIKSEELQLGQDIGTRYLRDEVNKQSVNHGFGIAPTESSADLIIDIKSNTRKGAENEGVFVSYLNIELKVLNAETRRQVYAGSLVDLKGVQLDYKGASDDAYKKSINQLDKKILREIQKVIFD